MQHPAPLDRVAHRSACGSGLTLVELLVVISIMSVVGSMLIFTWIALAGSFSNTTRSSDARDLARQAASRMEREIRDAEAQITTGPYAGRPAVLRAFANSIVFVTTFNDAGNDIPNAQPLAVCYYLKDGTLYMKRDANDDGVWDTTTPRSLVPNVVNGSVGASGITPVFSYTYIDEDGNFVTPPVSDASDFDTPPLTDDSDNLSEYVRGRIVSVTFTLLVDLNPGHSPTHMTLTTTAQLRNQRRF